MIGATISPSATAMLRHSAASNPAVLLFVAGQSNSRKSNTSALTGPARYASLGTVNIWDPVAVNWVAYTTTNASTRTCGHRAGTGGTPDRAWGTEAEFIYRMRQAGDNRPVYIIKEAVNGMSMAVDWQPPSGNRWVGIKGQIDAARSTLSAFTLAEATLWNQGEADANDAPSTTDFDTNFDNFMDNWRTSIRQAASLSQSVCGHLDMKLVQS
jgi:hypothetical protein